MARTSKLTAERQQKIVNLIQAGNFAEQAAQASGISPRTYHRWISQGEEAAVVCEDWEEQVEIWNDLTDAERRVSSSLKPDWNNLPSAEEYKLWQFWQAVKKAQAEAEAAAVLQIRKAAENTWQAAAWYLERGVARDRWRREDTVKHQGTVQHQHGLAVSEEEVEAARNRLKAAREPKSLPEGNTTPIIEAEAEEIKE